MSLDVYLNLEVDTGNGKETFLVFSANYTHNCNTMADAAGIYNAVWRPDEIGINTAGELIPLLRDGIAQMKECPEKFIALNPSNGWGSYDTFLPWLKEYLKACEKYPRATIEISR